MPLLLFSHKRLIDIAHPGIDTEIDVDRGWRDM